MEKMSVTLIEQIDMLSDIATEFSDFAKMPLTNNEKVDLKKIIHNSVELYKHAENLKINLHFDDKETFVYADFKQLLRVFNNILRNSVQAIGSKDDGIIDIDTSSVDADYLIKIQDNGIGINHEDAAKIFSPNFTTKTGGTGLGLPLAKNIIESAGGRIWFESETNKATTFYISIPIYR
jgi:signal transduction histidine kinase